MLLCVGSWDPTAHRGERSAAMTINEIFALLSHCLPGSALEVEDEDAPEEDGKV